MRRIELILITVLLGTGFGFGQAYVASVQLIPDLGVLHVDMYLATTSGTSAILGDATFTINYDVSVLTYIGRDAAMDGRWDNGNDGSYSDMFGSNASGKAGLNIWKSGSGTGLDIPGTATRIGRLDFTIVQPTGLPGITWSIAFSSPYNFAGVTIKSGFSWVNPDNNPLPVTLVSFTGSACASTGAVLLEWKTASEVNNYGYAVQRKSANDVDFADLKDAFVAGKGTTVEPQAYTYVDNTLAKAGTYRYRLKQQDMDGTVHYTQSVIVNVTVTDVAEVAPKTFQLLQNYPNPFNPSTQVKFTVEATGKAVVKVYNMLGEEVATLFDGTAEAGRYYTSTFDAAGLPSGVYFYRLTTGQKTDVKRMMVVK